jgi:ribosome biogenesis protein NSA1
VSNQISLSGISGTITSLACAPHHVGSTSLDRFFRLHGTASLEVPAKDRTGQTLEKVYTMSIPTVVVWDPSYEDNKSSLRGDGEGDQIWENMANAKDDIDSDDEVEEGSEAAPSTQSSQHKKSRTK